MQNQTDDTDQEDEEDGQSVSNATQNDSNSTSDTADNDSDVSIFEEPPTSAGTTTYFTTQLPGLGDYLLQLA